MMRMHRPIPIESPFSSYFVGPRFLQVVSLLLDSSYRQQHLGLARTGTPTPTQAHPHRPAHTGPQARTHTATQCSHALRHTGIHKRASARTHTYTHKRPHLVGGCLADEHLGQRHPKGLRSHLGHLCVQALAHLHAAVGDQHSAIQVHVHQRTGLRVCARERVCVHACVRACVCVCVYACLWEHMQAYGFTPVCASARERACTWAVTLLLRWGSARQ